MPFGQGRRAIILVPYEILGTERCAATDRFAAIGILSLSGRDQYREVFNTSMIALQAVRTIGRAGVDCG